jgi:predicted nucleic acid-binding protein
MIRVVLDTNIVVSAMPGAGGLRKAVPCQRIGLFSDVINGKRSISKNHARKLAEFFHVPVSMFI